MVESQKGSSRWWLGLVLSGYLMITVGYGVVTPLFEAPDENWHYFTVQYVADTWQLPVVEEEYDTFLSQEAAQPPLYYWLGAILIAPIDTSGARETVWPNPFAWAGDAAALANYNQFIHTEQEAWPWRGYVLAAHTLRLFSTLIGLGTLIYLYRCASLVLRQTNQYTNTPIPFDYPLLATALVAFLPQFNFVHASITNDALIIFLGAAALWQLIKLWELVATQGNLEGLRWRLVGLGVTIAAAILTKNAGTLLLVYALGFITVLAWRARWGGKRWAAAALSTLIPALLLSGWLWWRNWVLYGDPTAANVFVRIAGGNREYTLWQVLAETPSLWTSLFAVFGWFNVRAPDWVFGVWHGIVIVSVLGWLLKLVSSYPSAVNSEQSPVNSKQLPLWQKLMTDNWLLFTLLAGWVLLVYVGLVSFMLRTPAAQGRLLFPALVPLVVGLAAGFRFLVVGFEFRPFGIAQSKVSRWASRTTHHALRIIPVLALVTTLYCLLVVIPQAYARPQTVTTVPDAAAFPMLALNDELRLVGAAMETMMAQPGEPVWFTLYWRAETQPVSPPEQVVEFFGVALDEPVGRLHSYQGRGMYPANLWPIGDIVADRFAVRLNEGIDTPVLATGYVRLVQQGEGVPFGAVKIVPEQWPNAPNTTLATLGDGIELRQVVVTPQQVRPGDVVTVTVVWGVAAAPQGTFTTFVHLGDPTQPPLATGDNQPRQGHYPTSVWAAGEVIQDAYTLVIPPDTPAGRYPLWLGMYDAAANIRLPLTVNGQLQPNNAYAIGPVEVTR